LLYFIIKWYHAYGEIKETNENNEIKIIIAHGISMKFGSWTFHKV